MSYSPPKAGEKLVQQIADSTHPDKMSARDARITYEYLISWLEGSLEALYEEEAERLDGEDGELEDGAESEAEELEDGAESEAEEDSDALFI